MREVAEATRMVDSLKVAVLAALNIADEMFTATRAAAADRRTAASAWRSAWRWWKKPSNMPISLENAGWLSRFHSGHNRLVRDRRLLYD